MRGSEARSTARWGSGRSSVLPVLLVAVPSALVASLVTHLLFAPPRGGGAEGGPDGDALRSSTVPRTAPEASVAPGFHVNEAGGYAFRQPEGWTVSDDGSVSRLVSEAGNLAISFGLGGPGTLADASTDLVDSIRDSYRRVRVHQPIGSHLGRHRARVVGGLLVNEAGRRIRFLGIAVRLDGRNHVAAVFAPDRSAPQTVLPAVEEVLASLRAV